MVSTAKVAEALKGLRFPADKRSCVAYAQRHGASAEVMDVLQRMPEDKFDSMAGVWHAVGQVE